MNNAASNAGPAPASPLARWFDGAIRNLTRWCDFFSALICAALIVTTASAMLVYQFGVVIPWLDDVLRMMIIWSVYLGAVSLCLHNDHISMDAFYLIMPAPIRRMIDILIAIIAVAVCLIIARYSADTLLREIEFGQLLPSGFLPSWPQSLALPFCFSLMALAYLANVPAILKGKRQVALSEAEKISAGVSL